MSKRDDKSVENNQTEMTVPTLTNITVDVAPSTTSTHSQSQYSSIPVLQNNNVNDIYNVGDVPDARL